LAPRTRILAIDEQPYFRELLTTLLSAEGYGVTTAETGPEGLQILEREGPFDLVILDLVMPDPEGVETVGGIRARWPQQEVIVLTGVGDVHAVVSAMQRGASDYLLKPIDREALVRAIHQALERGRAGRETRQLVDENLEFMRRLSLVERLLPLAGEHDAGAAAHGLFELLATQLGARGGALWMCERPGGPLKLVVASGPGEDKAPKEWAAPSPEVEQSLLSGRPDLVDRSALLVPLVEGARLVAVCRLELPEGFSAKDLDATRPLLEFGARALTNALRVGELRRSSLRDAATLLPSKAFLYEVMSVEIERAQRYGRRLSCLCAELQGAHSSPPAELLQELVHAMSRTLRTTDLLCSEGGGLRFWVLVTETDQIGGVVLKRRIAERVRQVLAREPGLSFALGVASYPLDGETRDDLIEGAQARARAEHASELHGLGLDPHATLGEIGRCLLERATPQPSWMLADVAELLVGELVCRPRESGLLFLAPGSDPTSIMGPLMMLGESEIATEIFLATEGDTVPTCSTLTAVALPVGFSAETTWIVRFGEGPPYALVAGPERADGRRPVYHSRDPLLVERMTFQLCSEVGVGVRS